MKNILVTGSYGQLGNEIRILTENEKDFKMFLTDVDTLDICDYDAVDKFVSQHRHDTQLRRLHSG